MNRIHPRRPLLLLIPALAAAAWVVANVSARTGAADDGASLTAHSVCEAHELKARKAADPQLEIEIPAEFNSPWPTRAACLSHAGAADEEAPGPMQPIEFSHKHHAGLYEIDCLYCHTGTDRSPSAGVPSTEVCMGCHSQFPPSYDEFAGIQKLKDHWERKQPIEWAQVHRLPEHVQFRHNRHVKAGVDCQECHGNVEELDKLYMTEDTKWWPWLLPTEKLEMGWCIQCHRAKGASQDCYTCHY